MKDQGFYWTLPLGMTLDQYKAMYKLENYRSETAQDKIDYVEFDCAVISIPSSDEVDDMDQESIAASTKHLEMIVRMIQSYGIRTLNTTEQYISLRGEMGVWELDLKKNSLPPWLKMLKMNSFPEWKVILFKVKKEPIVLPDVLTTRDDVESYFEISK
jgi:hypothetical protein